MRLEGERRLAGRLLPGERVLWAGQPKQGLLLVAENLVPVLLTLVAGLVFILVAPLAGMEWKPFHLLALMVLGPAWLLLFVGQFVLDAVLRHRTWYAVTDRRILIRRDGPWGSFHALDLARLPAVELEEGPRYGTLLFDRVPDNPRRWSRGIPALDPAPQFLAIRDARAVFDLIQHATARSGAL